MAVATLTTAQTDLIRSMTQDEIPIKLRCAICSKLAVNAFRLPCCEQAICENCQSSLPSSCPVCEHTPVAAEDCKPNKSLRTTIRVFLRTEEKKREAVRLKDLKNASPITPTTPSTPVETLATSTGPLATTTNHEDQHTHREAVVTGAPMDESHVELANTAQTSQEHMPTAMQQDIPQPSIEEIAPGQEPTEEGTGDGEGIAGEQLNGPLETEVGEKGQDVQSSGMPGAQGVGFGMGFGFDPTAGGFPNMGLMGQGADFNQMQMMMAMQNGMTPNAFGGFPMMGMPGMTMDPMAMQNLYMNGGFGVQGMGMNGMNMGMGMGGYDGGVGAGFSNSWNGQQSWNVGQDNLNHTNPAGMGHGDYSSNNTGFQNSAGYNQGNYGRTNQYNDYQQNGYGHQNFSRGRGRGRGYGYGSNRAGYGYGHHDGSSHQTLAAMGQPSGSMSENGSIPTGPKADIASSVPPASNVDRFGREIRPNVEAQVSDGTAEPSTDDKGETTTTDIGMPAPELDVSQDKDAPDGDVAPKPIQTLEQVESISMNSSHAAQLNGVTSPSAPLSPSGASHRGQSATRGVFNGGYNDQSAPRSMQPRQLTAVTPKVLDAPINAPTGPKAMREGLPNTSLVNLRGRGGFPTSVRGVSRLGVSSTEMTSNSGRPRSESPRGEREEGDDRGRGRSPSDREIDVDVDRRGEKRRRHRHRSTSESEDDDDGRRSSKQRRRHGQRSTSMSDDGKEEESRRERRRRRERRHDEDFDEGHKNADFTDGENKRNGGDVERSRSQSPAESRRSSHRGRRDRERERERDRERDREHKSSSHKHRSSHRSHKDRSRSRSPSHDRDRERERRHRRRHESVEAKEQERDNAFPSTVDHDNRKPEITIPAGPRAMAGVANGKLIGIEIKGASSRRKSIHDADERRNGKDREREQARDRERDRDRNRKRDREHDRDPSRRLSTSTSTAAHPSIPTGPSALSPPARSKGSAPTSTTKSTIDPHTLEREARNRERLLKEAQRIAGLAAASSAAAGLTSGSGSSVNANANGALSGQSKKRTREESTLNMDENRKRRDRGLGGGERRERDRMSDRDRERDRERDRGDRARERDREIDRVKDRERERGKDRERERDRDRGRYTQGENEEDRIARLEGEREAERWA